MPAAVRRPTVVLEIDVRRPASLLRLAQHADQALEVKLLFSAAQADAGNLDRQILLRDHRHVGAAVDFK